MVILPNCAAVLNYWYLELDDWFASVCGTIYPVCRPRPSDPLSDSFDSFGQSGVGVVRLVVPGAEDILCADQGPGNRGLHEGTKAAKRCSAPSFCLQQVLSSVLYQGYALHMQ